MRALKTMRLTRLTACFVSACLRKHICQQLQQLHARRRITLSHKQRQFFALVSNYLLKDASFQPQVSEVPFLCIRIALTTRRLSLFVRKADTEFPDYKLPGRLFCASREVKSQRTVFFFA